MMIFLEYIVRIMMFLLGVIFLFGLYDKWVYDKEFDIEDIFVILFIIMFLSVSIGV